MNRVGRMGNRRILRQKGHAAILFVLMIPALFGLFSLSVDGAKLMQNEARLEDALEIASLAVAAMNDDNDDDGSGGGSQANQDIATAYVSEYMEDMTQISGLKITKLECEQIQECMDGLESGEPRFFEYQVEATTHHDTIFHDQNTFGDSYTVESDGRSRKYQNHAVDIVFVSDFSGSMYSSWSGGSQRKYLDLVDVIEAVTVELTKFNGLQNMDDSTVGYVGFNRKTQSFISETVIEAHWEWSGYTWKWIEEYTEVELCQYNQIVDNSASQTVSNIFNEKTSCTTKTIKLGDFYTGDGDDDAYFYDIPLTTDFTTLNSKVASFYPDHGTSSYQGLIRGAQLADQGDNPRRLIVVLSDGMDNYTSTTSALVNAGMCSTITDTLDSRLTSSGDEVSSKIAVIGFDYDVNSNIALQNCAGTNNVYKAENTTEILNIILGLIAEEVGHLK